MNPQFILLSILANIHPRMLAKKTLWSEASMDADELTYTSFKDALQRLEEKDQVVVITGEDRTKVKITQAGLARYAEATV